MGEREREECACLNEKEREDIFLCVCVSVFLCVCGMNTYGKQISCSTQKWVCAPRSIDVRSGLVQHTLVGTWSYTTHTFVYNSTLSPIYCARSRENENRKWWLEWTSESKTKKMLRNSDVTSRRKSTSIYLDSDFHSVIYFESRLLGIGLQVESYGTIIFCFYRGMHTAGRREAANAKITQRMSQARSCPLPCVVMRCRVLPNVAVRWSSSLAAAANAGMSHGQHTVLTTHMKCQIVGEFCFQMRPVISDLQIHACKLRSLVGQILVWGGERKALYSNKR